jgi:hypothetical protein
VDEMKDEPMKRGEKAVRANERERLGKRWRFKLRILQALNARSDWASREDIREAVGDSTTKFNKGFSQCIGQHTQHPDKWDADSLSALKLVKFRLVDPGKPKGKAEYKIETRGRRLLLQAEFRPPSKPEGTERSVHPFRYPDEVSDPSGLPEGAVKTVVVNAFERKRSNRQKCITARGVACSVCEMEFGTTFGPIAQGYIHVHHLHPLSDVHDVHQVDPIKDLRPVCPNCHAVLHMGEPLFTIEQVKEMLRRACEG